jgi:hypothetical protein
MSLLVLNLAPSPVASSRNTDNKLRGGVPFSFDSGRFIARQRFQITAVP